MNIGCNCCVYFDGEKCEAGICVLEADKPKAENGESEFIDIDEDMSQIRKGFSKVSIDIDVILKDGTIIKDCFCDVMNEKFYDKRGHILYTVKGWRTMI